MDDKAIPGAPWVLILGPKGAGKTRLAATGDQFLCFDTEPPGAASAYPEEYRISFTPDTHQYLKFHNVVKDIRSNGKPGDRCMEWQGKTIRGITVDTFDTLQKFLIARYLEPKANQRPSWIAANEIWAPKMEMQDWGTILNFQAPLITDLKALPIPVIWVAHTKQEEPIYKMRQGENVRQKAGRRGPDVAGSIENWILNLCDYILNLTVGDDGIRTVYTQPGIENDYMLVAADRHRLFLENGAKSFDVPVDEKGNPKRRVIDFI